MLKYGKRILTVLLALVLVAGFCGLLANPVQAAQSSKVVSQQVSLGDDLTMNFLVSAAPDNQDGTLTVSVAGEEVGSYAVSSMTPDENGDYRVSAELAAAQMTDTVNLTLTDGVDTAFSKNYSVQSYAHALLDENNGYSDEVKTMAKSMLNYGAMAQKYFDYKQDSLANDGYEMEYSADLSAVEAPEVKATGMVDGLSFYGASLVFRGKVAVRYYFEAPNGVADFTFCVDGVPYEAKEKGSYYYVEVPGITPENYGKAVTMTAGTAENTICVSYSPMSYLVRMYGKTESGNLKTLLQAMYDYHETAVKYLEQDNQDSEVELPYSPVFYSMYQYEEFIGNLYPVSLSTLFGTDDTINENAVIEVTVENISGTATGEYTPAYSAADWYSSTIQFSGTGKVKITVNNATAELTVENTSYSYPYNHNYPTFYPMYTSEQYYIGNATVKLGDLFMSSGNTIDEASVVTLEVVIPEGSNASVTYSEDFAASDWSNVDLTFSGTGAVELRLNEGASLTLVVENTKLDYPYTHNTPSFQPVDMTKTLIGNATVYLDKIFETYSEVNEASVIDVTLSCMSDSVTAEYIPPADITDWKSGYIVFSGTGEVQISINGTSLTLTVENTNLDYPYVHVYPEFEAKVSGTGYYIGADCDVYLSSLFTTSFGEIGQDAIVALNVEIPEGSEVSVTYDSEFAAADWENVKLLFVGSGAVNITLNNATVQLTVENTLISEPYTHPKFAAKYENTGEYYIGNQGTVYLGSLFERVDALETDAVIIIRTDYQDGSWNERTEYSLDFWQECTLTFDQTGPVKITVNGTELQLIVEESDICTPYIPAKFDLVFENTDKYLYRVGNANTVALGSLFELKKGDSTVSPIDVTVEAVDGANAGGTYTEASSWENSTIQFTGTGPVMVTINETVLYLEVVDGKNVTTAASATANNVVLLCDVSGSFSVSGGYTFYGNGFTVTLPTSSLTDKGNGFVGYVNLSGGHLDTVRIVGPVFPEQYIYRSQAEITDTSDPDYGDGSNMRYFHNSVIINAGSCNITNSYISGGRTAICIKDGVNVLIEDTTISGGAYANLQVRSADSVMLRDVTTEQREVEDSYGQGKKIIGIGIVIDDAETEIYLEGTLTQNNWINETQWNTLLGDYSSAFPEFFTNSTYECYWHYRDGDTSTKYVDLTMIFACDWDSTKLHDNRTTQTPAYVTKDITVATANGAAYSVSGAGTLTDADFAEQVYAPSTPYPVAPGYVFDYETKNYVANTEGSNEYCYEDGGVVKISFDQGGSKVWDTSILTVTKGAQTIPYTVSMDGTDYTGSSITFTAAGNYVVTYTYTDPYNYKLDESGNVVSYGTTYTKTVSITVSVVEAQAKNAEFTMGSNGQAVEKRLINNSTYLSASGLDNSSWTSGTGLKFPQSDGDTSTISFKYSGKTNGSWGSATINGQTFYFPVVAMGTTDNKFSHTGSWYGCFPVFEGAITITDYADGGTAETGTVYNSSTTTMPSNLSALYPQTVFRYQGTQSSVPTTPSKMTKGTYSGKLCYTTQTDLSASNERGEEWNLATYTYTDNKGTTYYWYVAYYCAASTNGSCFTPDTLITLADGTQKQVCELTFADKVLVWDFFTGNYAEQSISLLVNHGEAHHDVTYTKYSDGSELKIIGDHGVFDYDLNKFIYITPDNVQDFIGHRFVKQNLNGGYDIVTMTEGYVVSEYTEAWSITSVETSNVFASGLLTVAPPEDFYNWIEMDGKLHYNVEQFQKDVETYGLYTYEDFKDYVTYQQFIDWNGAYLKIPVEKGYFTFDYILELIELYKGWMPQE